jgi:hypothetical protein
MKRPLLLLAALLALGPSSRADSIENHVTTESVSVSVGCWNPALCGDPADYWQAWDLPLPVVEPPAADFSPVTGTLLDWDDPSVQCQFWPADSPVSASEPSALVLLVAGLMFGWLRRR